MTKSNAVVAICSTHAEAETGVKELQHAAFDRKQLSIVGRAQHTDGRPLGTSHGPGCERGSGCGKTL